VLAGKVKGNAAGALHDEWTAPRASLQTQQCSPTSFASIVSISNPCMPLLCFLIVMHACWVLLQSAFEKAHQASLAVYDDPPSCISYPIDGS
jgi:hypothetical protein